MSSRGNARGRGRGARGNIRGTPGDRGRGRGTRGAPLRGGARGRGFNSGTRGGGAPRPVGEILEDVVVRGPKIPEAPVTFEKLTPPQLRSLKNVLLNTVSSSLIKEPRFNEGDSITNVIKRLVKQIAFYDPEFILKLVLYTRDELGIRSTSNFVLAVASNIRQCQPFLKKYFNSCTRLPSDWLDVASTYQSLPDKYLKEEALPTSLRKAMVEKFSDFDVYQLGKYNKERSIKRKNKKAKALGQQVGTKDGKPVLTIKQMIRQLHIAQPTLNVMCILGKKYPKTEEDFRRLNLPGAFEPARAGKRMKLPVPETWETFLSEKGNRASTWEELIEHKKLPFMAMLRNLNNLIFTGVHPRYHRWVMNKLTNEGAVASSRQFPTRFFSAYEVIPKDLEDFKQRLQNMNNPKKKDEAKAAEGEKAEEQKRRAKKRTITPAYMPPASLFQDYREALDTAVKLATVNNVKPIRGSTVVFVNAGASMKTDCNTAKGMGAIKKLNEVGSLLGLMCKYACEECEMRVFSSPSAKHNTCHLPVELIEGSILDNMKIVLKQAEELGSGSDFPFDYVEELIRNKKRIDNFIILSHELVAPGHKEMNSGKNSISNIFQKYRQEVNPDLLFVSVDLSGRGVSVLPSNEQHPNDVLITGFSDSILRFIAERGDSNQLRYVENIDVTKKLAKSGESKIANAHLTELDKLGKDEQSELEEEIMENHHLHAGQWKTAKVFISSTFLDMHGERDVLTRHVFPELRERCKKRKVHLLEVDLRWGVTEQETQENKSVQICLEEIDRCRPFFVGLLGTRYGWAPASYNVEDEEKFDWLKDYPTHRSITELEIQYGCLRDPNSRAFFYLRDPKFIKDIPEDLRKNFWMDDRESNEKMENLKKLVRSSGRPVTDYRCVWAGVIDNKPMVKGLEKFRQAVLEDLWSAICEQFPVDEDTVSPDELTIERSYHLTFMETRAANFVGRNELIQQISKQVDDDRNNTVVVVGKPGAGKSALVAKFTREYAKNHPSVYVLPHFIGPAPKSTDIRHTLRRLCRELSHRFGPFEDDIPDDYKELCQAFVRIVEQSSFKKRILLVIDALDQLSAADRAHSLDWLPANLPVKVLVSTLEGPSLEVLRRRIPKVPEVLVGPLAVKERKEIVKETLSQYRKKLDDRPMNDQERVLLKKTDADKPLYLILACQELRVFGVYEQLTEKIKSMAQTIPRLFEEILTRLEGDHGKEQIRTIMSLLACSRGGLVESEMLILLRRKHKNEAELPRAVWARIFSSLEAFLRPTGDDGEGTLDFFHREMGKAVRKRYLDLDQEQELKTHKILAEYFYLKADPDKDGNWNTTDSHAISELPHHLVRARMWKVLEKCLCSLQFIETKCSMGMAFDLNRDYIEACSEASSWKSHERERLNVEEFYRFVSSNSHILHQHPELTYQQAINQPDESSPAKVAALSKTDRAYLRWVNKPQQKDPCKLTIKLADAVTAVAVSPEGDRIVCALKDCSLKLFDSRTSMELVSLIGHTNWVTACAFSPDASQIVSSSWDQTLKLWDSSSGIEQATMAGHARLVSCCVFSPDNKAVLSGSWDCKLMLWDSIQGKQKKFYRGHSKPVNACAFNLDGKWIVSASWDGVMILWDSETAAQLKVMSNGQYKSIRSCQFSPNGKQIVSASVDNTIRIWDAHAGKEVASLVGHSKPVNACAYSQDGQQLVSASDDGTLKVWDGILGCEVKGTKCASGWMNHISYSPDGQQLVTAGSECYLVIWDANDFTEVGRLIGHTRAVNHGRFSPNGRLIASASDDSSLIVWDVGTRTEKFKLVGHRDAVNMCAFSVDGTLLVSASEDFTLKLWNPATGKEVTTMYGHTAVVKSAAFSPNGKYIASAGRDCNIKLWNAKTGESVATFKGHMDWINVLAWSPDSKKLVTGSWDYNLKVWDVRKGKEKVTLAGHASSLSGCEFTKDGKRIVSSCYDGTMKVWDAEAGSEITTLIGHESRVNQLCLAPDSVHVASCSDDGTLKIWDMLAGIELATLVGHAGQIQGCAFSPQPGHLVSGSEDCTVRVWDSLASPTASGHSKPVNCLALSPDSNYVVSGSDDQTLKVFETATGVFTGKVLHGHTGSVRGCAYSPLSTEIASAADDCTVRIWDADSGKQTSKLDGHTNTVTCVAYSPNGSFIASGSWDREIILWSRAGSSYKLSKRFSGHTDWINCVAFSPDGKFLISGGCDNVLLVWDLSRGTVVHRLAGHSNWIKSCSFSVDGTALSASFDGALKAWDMRDGSCLFTIQAHDKCVNSCAFSANGKAVLSASSDGTLKVWSVKKQQQVAKFVLSTGCTAVAASKQIALATNIGHLFFLQFEGL